MIYGNSPKFYNKLIKLKGYINNKTVNKYISKNHTITEKKLKLNLNYLMIFLILFCGSLFLYHIYTLWLKHKNGDTQDLSIKLI